MESRFCLPVAHKGSFFIPYASQYGAQSPFPGIGRAAKMQIRRSRMASRDVEMVVARIGRPISVKIKRCAVTGKGTCRQRLTQRAVHEANSSPLRVQGTDGRRIRQIPRSTATKGKCHRIGIVCRLTCKGMADSCRKSTAIGSRKVTRKGACS